MQRGISLFLCFFVLGRAAVIPDKCQNIDALHHKLLYDNRVTYMCDYFPTDYKLYVKYEEVLRCQNITTLINKGITVKELRYLWGIVNEGILLRIQKVLPLRHPSLPYINELVTIFRELIPKEEEVSSDAQEILDVVKTPNAQVIMKPVSPKALLDNCLKVLRALYEDECRLCDPRSDPEDTPCAPGTVPALYDYPRPPCQS